MKSIVDALKSHPQLYEKYRKHYDDHARNLITHPEVMQLIETQKLSEDLVRLALSEIRHWLQEKENCEHCPGLNRCPNMFWGHKATPNVVEGKLYFDYEPCQHYAQHIRERRQKKLFQSHLIPHEALKVTFDDLEMDKDNAEVIKKLFLYCKEFYSHNGRGLFLYGNFGVGKTYLMGAVASDLVSQGYSVYFVHVPAFFREMKHSLADQSFLEKIKELEQVDCLILDDIGAENLSPWLRDEVLGPLLQYRTQNLKPILYTSNLSYDQLEEHLSETNKGDVDLLKSLRIMERIRSYTEPLFMSGRNRRKSL